MLDLLIDGAILVFALILIWVLAIAAPEIMAIIVVVALFSAFGQ